MLAATAAMVGILWAAFFVISRPIRNMLEEGSRLVAWFALGMTGLAMAISACFIDLFAGVAGLLLVIMAIGFEISRQRAYSKETRRDRVQGEDVDLDPAPGTARESFRQAQAQAMLVSLGGLFLAVQPTAATWMAKFLIAGDPGSWAAALSLGTFVATWLGRFEKLPAMVRKALLLIAATLAGPLLLWGASLVISAAIAAQGGLWIYPDLGLWNAPKPWVVPHDWLWIPGALSYPLAYAASLVVLALILWKLNDLVLYDANEASPHSYYRDKLGATFLFSADPANAQAVVKHADLKLSRMDTGVAPLALINAALNFIDRDAYRGRGRNAAFFTFSPLHIGGTLVGYVPTHKIEEVNSRLRLSSAVAISGAAASANMGRNTNPAFRFLLALINVRLGYWLANPRRVACHPEEFARSFWRNGRPRPGAGALIREMVGDLTTKRRFINLSDGGHLENLGVYELVRRRCRVIIAVDAEQDGDMAFRALGDVVRFCRIDHATAIDLDTKDIRPNKRGISALLCHRPNRLWARRVRLARLRQELPDRHRERFDPQVQGDRAGVPAPQHRRSVLRRGAVRSLSRARFHMLSEVFGKFLPSLAAGGGDGLSPPMSRRIDKSWLVFASIENPQHDRCVDLFRRPDDTYGFEEFRAILRMPAPGRRCAILQRRPRLGARRLRRGGAGGGVAGRGKSPPAVIAGAIDRGLR